MDAKISEKTRETLGKLIKRPPLTEKLLGKPPFRFLHDILTEVMKNTGFLDGLYSGEELNSQNVKDKESKMRFLQKAIDVTVFVTRGPVSCRPSKVVAGQEPEKTNEFLQILASAVLQKKDSREAVERVLNGEKPDPAALGAAVEKSKKESSSSSSSRRKEKEKESTKKETREKEKRKDKTKKKREDEPVEKEPPLENGVLDTAEKEKLDDEGSASGSTTRLPRPSSAKGSRTRSADARGGKSEPPPAPDAEEPAPPPPQQESTEDHLIEETPVVTAPVSRVARPSSARPAPPRVKTTTEPALDNDLRISSGRERAAPPVIVDDKAGDESNDDDDDDVADEGAFVPQPDIVKELNPMNDDEEDHGALVNTLVNTQKKFAERDAQVADEKSLISEAHWRKERERVEKEIERLVSSIQGLTSSAHPLGRTMDYIQEDLDSMHKELAMWKKENATHAKSLKREEEITDAEIQPLRDQLKELDSQIGDQVELIRGVKTRLVQNDEQIRKLLNTVALGSRQT